MKLVEFNRDMRPHKKGDTRVVPDEVADRLVRDGEARLRPSVFDTQAPDAVEPKRRRHQTRGLF